MLTIVREEETKCTGNMNDMYMYFQILLLWEQEGFILHSTKIILIFKMPDENVIF